MSSTNPGNTVYSREAGKVHWYARSRDDLFTHYNTDPENGLDNDEVKERRNVFGYNQLRGQKRKTVLQMFFSHMQDALIYVLLAAVAVTAFMGEYMDSVIILVVVFINAVLGVVQEFRAGNAIESLRKLTVAKAVVKRTGQTIEINSHDLVPGDIVVLDAGRFVPADIRLTASANLKVDESALTGESVPVEKNADDTLKDEYIPIGDRNNMVYMSTFVTYGRGIGVVVNTGNDTEVGKIADIIHQEDQVRTPLEIRLDELGKTLGKIAVGICAVMFIIAWIQGRELAEMFLTAVSLAVASIPEGLAAIVAIVLSIGVTKMAKQNAIIKKLPAVETLGSVNIVCSDKTGTLTQNKMTVTQYYTFTGGHRSLSDVIQVSDDERFLAEAMILSSDATYENGAGTGDPTEIALLMMGDDMGIDRGALSVAQPRLDELSFDSVRKMMSTLHSREGGHIIYAKGALDNLILRCTHILEEGQIIPCTKTHRFLIAEAAEKMSEEALRTLAAAFKPVQPDISKDKYESGLVLIGVVGMIDPPREEVKESVSIAKKAGISTVMITGDHKNTAFAIARELGIAEDISQTIAGADINHMDESTFKENVLNYRVYARVSPEHKANIVKAIKEKGNIVSMTGDGVNDAPSLNAADIGVAMGITGTDVAKNASDMILADDNFSTIISAIEQGRNIYNNIKKSVIFLLASNVGEVITMLSAILLGMPVPLLATQLLWINLLTDTLPAVALGMDPGNADVMNDKPRKSDESFFAHGAGTRVVRGGILIGALTLSAFWLGYHLNGFSPYDMDIPDYVHDYSRTLAFMTIIACQLFYSLSFRHDTFSVFKVGIASNPYLLGAIIIGFALQVIVLYIPFMSEAFHLQPLDIRGWVLCMGLGLVPLLANELIKFIKRKKD